MLILTIWPLFALICLGFVLSWRGFPDAGFWPAAERINYFVLFPALLVRNLSGAPLDDPDILRLGGAMVAVILTAFTALSLIRLIRPSPARRFGPTVQGVIRFNTYLGLAVTSALTGPAGLERAAVCLAVGVPLVNVLSIMALTEGSAFRNPRLIFRTIFANPLILACILGIALALTGTGLPFGIGGFLGLIAQASLPLGLLCVGAALRPSALGKDGAALIATLTLRLAAMPALALVVARLIGLGTTETLVLTIFAAIPTAPTAYVLTRQLGGDATFMAGLITAQTVAAVVTIPVILAILGLA
ncbi:MAG: AEC family transporter [Pseudomonadota bacterium]|nr:AEC family transporter [Pseudomonadota bacterium]